MFDVGEEGGREGVVIYKETLQNKLETQVPSFPEEHSLGDVGKAPYAVLVPDNFPLFGYTMHSYAQEKKVPSYHQFNAQLARCLFSQLSVQRPQSGRPLLRRVRLSLPHSRETPRDDGRKRDRKSVV